jgi:hypothetical protein
MLIGVGWVSWPCSSPPHFLTHPSTLQAGGGGGGGSGGVPCPLLSPSPSLFHPSTTPQTVACEAGGVWGIICGGPASWHCGVCVKGG